MNTLYPAALALMAAALSAATHAACPPVFDHTLRKLHSTEQVNLCTATAGHPTLVVNTASHCGFTPQLKGLEALSETYKDKGLVVLGFASNDFRQAAKSEAEAATICYKNYGVNFMMLAPSNVTGPQANPVFAELARQSTEPQWNFNKYLIDGKGNVVAHFDSATRPDSDALRAAIEEVL